MATLAYSVAANVKALRESRRWSQEELAEAAGLSRDAISRIERGDREPRLATLEAIACAAGLEVGQLLGSGKKPARTSRQTQDARIQSLANTVNSLEPWLADALTSALRLIGRAHARARKRK
jgi:transcriptional regulator with XRE-family HTH domain